MRVRARVRVRVRVRLRLRLRLRVRLGVMALSTWKWRRVATSLRRNAAIRSSKATSHACSFRARIEPTW